MWSCDTGQLILHSVSQGAATVLKVCLSRYRSELQGSKRLNTFLWWRLPVIACLLPDSGFQYLQETLLLADPVVSSKRLRSLKRAKEDNFELRTFNSRERPAKRVQEVCAGI